MDVFLIMDNGMMSAKAIDDSIMNRQPVFSHCCEYLAK